MVGLLYLTTVLDNGLSLFYPKIDNVDGLHLRASAIAAQVEDERCCTLFLQVNEGTTHILGASFSKLVQIDIANAVFQ